MKTNLRWLSALVILVGMVGFSFTAEAAPWYWQRYLQNIAEKFNRPDLVEQYQAKPASRTVSNRMRFSSTGYAIPYTPTKQTTTIAPNFTRRNTTQSRARVRVRPLSPRQNVLTVDDTPIEIFELGFSNQNSSSRQRYYAPILINRVKFSLIDNTGIAEKYTNLSLSVNGEAFRFDTDGSVTLNLNNLRLASGEDTSVRVALQFADPNNVPHIPGSLRVRVDGVTGVNEGGRETFAVPVIGTTVSELIGFDPIPQATGTPVFLGDGQTRIFGKMLSVGDEAYVMAVEFNAAFDDLLIEKLTLVDALSNTTLGSFVDRISAIDLDTGAVLATSRFNGSTARFIFPTDILVLRNSAKKIGFKISIADRIYASQLGTEFRLNLLPSDVTVRSRSNGNSLADSNKSFSIENETFTVSNGSVQVSISNSARDRDPVITGKKATQLVFSLINGSNQNIQVARLNFDIGLQNLAFPGGISTDDFDISLTNSRGTTNNQVLSTTKTLTGNGVIFDFDQPVNVNRDSNRHLALLIAVEDDGAIANSDSISMSLNGDGSRETGTLDQLEANGANFIWSDTLSRIGNQKNPTWFNGFQVSGISSETIQIRRDN